MGQCVTRMVSADLFNHAGGPEPLTVFGCVTTGETWQFQRHVAKAALFDRRRIDLDRVEEILEALVAIARAARLMSR